MHVSVQGGVTRLAYFVFAFTRNSLTEQLTTFSRGFASLKVAIESHNTKGMQQVPVLEEN